MRNSPFLETQIIGFLKKDRAGVTVGSTGSSESWNLPSRAKHAARPGGLADRPCREPKLGTSAGRWTLSTTVCSMAASFGSLACWTPILESA